MARRKSTAAAEAADAIRAGQPSIQEKQRTFTVTKASIKGLDGIKKAPGEEVKLTKGLAEHYHKLGYITIPVAKLFEGGGDADDPSEAGDDT